MADYNQYDFIDKNIEMEQDETITLNKDYLTNFLEKLLYISDIKEIRNNIFQIKNELISHSKDDKFFNTCEKNNIMKISYNYFNNELNQIIETKTIERIKYYIKRLIKSLTEIRTGSINDINLNRWKEYSDIITDSLWFLDKRDKSGAHLGSYWGNFIPQIPNQFLRRYTKKNEWVLDPFLGSGTTLIECKRLGRNGIGIELQKDVATESEKIIEKEQNIYNVKTEIITGDSTQINYKSILSTQNINSVQFLIMHPPYWDIIKFSDDPCDLSNSISLDDFLKRLSKIIDATSLVLDKGRYFALVIGDKYEKGEWIPLGFLAMQEVLKRNYILKSIIVKNFKETKAKRKQQELWRYRALVGGFYIFKHEYIFLFKRK